MTTAPTVLVIEDSPVVQHVLRATLTPLGVDLLMAADGETGLELARSHQPELITLDIGLPGINGWEVLTALRGRSETVDIRVVVLTAHVQESMMQMAVELGADGFLPKPFQPEQLRSEVASLLEPSHLVQLAAGL
ncbi:MAG: response regulator [Acidimicrobiia bacterium]|nr:response regulator [Acidimicrobiia bacterium]